MDSCETKLGHATYAARMTRQRSPQQLIKITHTSKLRLSETFYSPSGLNQVQKSPNPGQHAVKSQQRDCDSHRNNTCSVHLRP